MAGLTSDHMEIAALDDPRPTLKRGFARAKHLARYQMALQACAASRPLRMLDIGCGIGYGSRLLANAGHDVLAIDINADNIAQAKARFCHPSLRLEYRHSPIEAFEARDRFDAITCFEVIEHLERPEPVIARIAALLTPGGVLCLSTPNATFWGGHSGNPHHRREFTPEQLKALLGAHFRALEVSLLDGPPGYEEFDRLCRGLDHRRRPEGLSLAQRLTWRWRRWRVRKHRSARHVIAPEGFRLAASTGQEDRLAVLWARCGDPIQAEPGPAATTPGMESRSK